MRFSLFLLAFALVLAACGTDTPEPQPAPVPAPVAEAPAPDPEPEPVPAFDGPAAEITLTPIGNEMKFEQTDFTVQPGQTVTLTFTNTADNPAMSHNVVILKEGTNVAAFGRAAMSAADTDYVPSSMSGQVIAHTAMSAPGETVTVEFTAPAAGTYTYVCTFPGHFMTMQGTMTVQASA